MTTNETQTFVNGLNKLNFISYDEKTFLTLEGFEVSFELKIMDTIQKEYPIQFLFYIKKDGLYISSWGCYSNECNSIASKWVLTTKNKLRDQEYDEQDKQKALAKSLFNQLTK
jgi:hypothetical protein